MRKSTETSVWAAIFIVCGCIFGVCLACWVTGCSAEQREYIHGVKGYTFGEACK